MSDNGQQPAAVSEKPWQELEEDKRQADATGLGLRTTWDGTVYQFHFGELSAADVSEFRRQTGCTTSTLFAQAAERVDADTVAMIVWLSRWLAGDRVPYADVAAVVMWQPQMAVELAEAVPVAPPTVADEATGEAVHPQP